MESRRLVLETVLRSPKDTMGAEEETIGKCPKGKATDTLKTVQFALGL
jgi:hypothetical protein